MKQTINKRLTIWLLTLVLAVVALPALTAPAQAAEKTPVDVVFGTETVKGEKEKPYGTTFVHCENVTYSLEKPDSNDPYYAAYTTWATGDIRIADTVDGLEVRKIRSGFAKELTGKVTLGKNIRSLDYSVFSGGKLREVTIPADSKLYRICQYAFRACPNLVRVGVGNTDKLPTSVTDIDYYAFYESPAIKSIDLTQTKVKSIDDCTFTDCTALASVKLPEGLTSIGHSAFKGCTALKALDVPASVKFIGMDTFSYSGITDLKLRCGAVNPEGMSIARSLMAMPDGAKVYLPKPSNTADYEKAMQFIYGNGQYTYCGANAKVKTYWMDGTAPVTEPSARSNSVVTLSGTDKSGNTLTFNYDYTDADKDGLGAVIRLSGRQTGATLMLTLNGSGTTNNTNAVIFTRVRAYDARHQGNIDSTAYSGKELTELLLRQQAVNYSSSINNTPKELSLALGSSDKLGLYYFIPTLVNKGSASQPMNAKTLPPVLVIYTPTDGANEGVGLEASFGSSNKWFCGDAENADFSKTGLPGTYPLYADGFEACFGTASGVLTKGKEAYFNGGQNSITYQWKRVNKDGSNPQLIGAQNYDYSKAGRNVNGTACATFNCYENVLPRGLQYCIGGLSGSYLQSLYNSSGTGTYYFQPTITVKVNGTVTNSVTGPIQSITFYDELTRLDDRMEVVSNESGTGNVTGPVQATGAPYSDIRQYTMKKGTINAYADIDSYTNLWGLKNKDYDGTIVYDWYYENNAKGSAKVYFKDAGPNLPLDQLAKEKAGTYTVFCNVSVRDGKGETVLKSNSGTGGFYCWVEVTSAAANYPAGMPSFDNFPKAIYFDLNYQSGTFKIPAPGTNMFAGSFSTRKLELFEVDSRDQNRDGVLRISGTVKMDNDGEFARIGDVNIPNVINGYKCVFPDFKARWCYYKYTLTDSAGKTYVVYSPTVAVQPSLLNPPAGGPIYGVYRNAAMPEKVEVKVTGQPHSEYWLPDSRNVTLTAELETKNYPLIYQDSRRAIFKWYSVDAGKNLTANANFTQSVRIDSADIDADGNLLLKGALSATFKRGSGNSDDYFDPTLPDGTPVSAANRMFDLRGAILVSSSNITWTPSNFTDPFINTVTIHPTTVSVAAPTANVTGGRLVPVWNGDTGKYAWGAAPAGEFAENEYRLFSERFDGKAAGDYSNIPASPEAVKITAATTTSGATIRWRVTVSDGTGNVISTTDLKPGTASVTYDSDTDYTDKATAAWSSGGSNNSTLTVAIPTGAEAKKLTVQPMAVKTNGNQITGLTYGDVYEVYTNRAAKATTPTISNVYSGAPTYKVSRDQLAAAEEGFEFASPNIWVGTGGRGDTTYRWYLSRTADERSVDIGTAIPLSEEMTVSGGERDYSVLSLTAQLLRQYCTKIDGSYSDILYIYAYAQNYDPTATKVQYAEKLMKVCKVEVGNFYAMPAVPITGYTGQSTVDIYYGQKAPEEMFSITIPLPADKTRYSVRLRGAAKSTDGTMAEDQSTSSAAILQDNSPAAGAHSGYEKRGNYYVYIPTMTYSSNVPQMTVTIDEGKGTATFTVDQGDFPNLALTSIYVNGIGNYESVNLDFEFYWYVYGEYFGDANTATGGNRTETTGTKYTVHRRQYPLSLTNLSFYTGTAASYTGTTEKPIPGAENTAFWGGETYKATLPGFRQHSGGYGDTPGLRPVTVTVGSSDAPWVLVRMELWNETTKEWEKLVNSSMVSATGETREYSDGSTTYTLVKPGSTVSMLTGPDAYFSGGNDPRFLRIAAYPMGVNTFAEGSDVLTSIDRITPAKQIFVVQPLMGDPVDAATPAYSNSSGFEYFTFIARDSSVTEHTFGADAWTVSDGGTLSYQWMFYDDKAKEYKAIDGETNPTLTVTRAQAKAWCEHNGAPHTSLKLEVTNTNTKSEITGNRYVTTTYSTVVYYEDSAVTPRVSITADGKTNFLIGEQGGTLTGAVSNAAALTNPSYAWGCRVTHAVKNDGTPYTAPADTEFRYLSKDDVAGADTNTLKLYAIADGNDYEIDGNTYSMSGGGWYSLWDSYKEVTIEYRLEVSESYTAGGNTTSATGTSSAIAVTIKRPEQVTALSVMQNGAYAVPPYILRDDAPLTFTAPAAEGSAPRSYVWAHSSSATGNIYNTVSSWTEQTLVLTKDGHWSSAPYILCVMTDTYTDPNSKKTLELETESNRILVQYMGAEAAVPQFTKSAQTVAADPGATGKSFDSTAIVSEPGSTITYAWKKINTLTGAETALSDTTATLSLNGHIPADPGKWSFVCTATNIRSDGKTAENTITHTLYVRGAVLTANLTEVDIAAGDSAEITLTATTYGLDGAEFSWTATGTGTPKWSLTGTPSGAVSGDMATVTNTAKLLTAAGSTGSIETAVLFRYTPSGESTERKTAISLKGNIKPFAVEAREIVLTMGEAVPADTKLTVKGTAAGVTWSVVNYDELDAAGVTVSADGTLSGTPTVPGPYRIKVQAAKGSDAATGIVTVYVKIPERDELQSHSQAKVSVGEKMHLPANEDHSGAGWSWDTRTGVLTLQNYSGEDIFVRNFDGAPLYIRLKGSSTLTSIEGDYGHGTVLCGSGNLTVSGGTYLVQYDLDVRGSGKIKLIGTTPYRSAVYGKLTVGEKGDVEITSSVDDYTAIEGTLAVNGGKLNITLTGARSKGIAQERTDTEITGGTATITVKGSGDCRGISGGGVQVSGGKLTVDVEIPGGSDDTYAVYSSAGSIAVKNGGELNIIGKGVVYGIYGCIFDVDGGKLKVDITRTGGERGAIGVYYGSNFACSVKNGGTLNIDVKAVADSAGNSGGAKGLICRTLEVEEGSTATITAKSGGIANAVELEHITCDGTVNLNAEAERGTASASASNTINVWGKGRLKVDAQGKFASPFYNVTFNGTDGATPLTVTTHVKSTVADGVAYLNNGQVTTAGNVNVTMTVESAVPDARAYGIQSSMSLNHTAGFITLKAAAGTALETQLTGSVSYDAAKIAVTGNPKGKDFVTYTAISADALLISNTSGGAVTLYQNTELSTDELTFTAKGGAEPYTWAVTGTLPAGMSLSAAEGAQVKITGTPTTVGSSTFTLTATDSGGKTASAAVTVTVKAADLVFAYSTSGIFRDGTLYLPLSSDWATNTHGDEKLYIESVSGDIDKKLTSAESDGVLRCYAGYSDYISFWIKDTSNLPKVGDTGTVTVKLRKDKDTVVATYTYKYEFVKDNPRYLTVGSRKFPAMLGDANGTGSKGSWSWDCAKSTLTLDNYEGTNGNSLVWADRKFSGLTVIYKGNVVADGVRYINHENLPGLTYKPFDDNATLTMKQQSSSYNKDYGVAADITFEGGNVTLYPRRRLVDPNKSEKVYVKDAKKFIISDAQLYNDETLGADVVVPQYTTDYWLYKAENDRVMSCGSAVPAIESVEIEGANTVSQSGTVGLTAKVFPTWLPDAKKFDKDNKALGNAFEITYTWDPAIGTTAGTTVDAKTLFGATPAVGAEKTVKCTAQLKFGGSSSAPVTSAEHTITAVADGVKVSGQVRSYNPGNATTIQLKQSDTVKYETTITKTTGSEQVTQDFNLDTVAAGTYDLVVTKDAHLTYTVKNVVVGGTDLDLTKHSNPAISTMTLLCGDINGDESINVTDLNKVWDAANFNKNVSAATNKLTDINGDGSVNVTDLNVIWDAANFNKGVTACTYDF